MIGISCISYQVQNNYIEFIENQTAIIPLRIYDLLGNEVLPTKLRWQLTNLGGDIINNRSFSVVQTVFDEINLEYEDLSIVNGNDRLILSIAVGATINNKSHQENTQIRLQLLLDDDYPNLFGVDDNNNLDDPFDNLDDPFQNLDEPWNDF